MAEQPDTPRTLRKRILSATPLNTETVDKKQKEGDDDMSVSPKLIQDLKKRVVEIDEYGKIKSPNKSSDTGNDIRPQGHDPDKMADHVNKPPIGQALGIKDVQKAGAKISQAETEGASNIQINAASVGELGAAVDVSKRITRSAVRRGRPRRRGLSMDPPLSEPDDMMIVLLNLQEKMSNAQIEREQFNNATINSIDTKFQDVKNSFDASVQNIKFELSQQNDMLKLVNTKNESCEVRVSDAEVRLNELAGDMLSCKGASDTLVSDLNEHVSNVETSLASDIENVKSAVELKIDEERQYQLQLGNRMSDMASNIGTENERLSQDMISLKDKFKQLKTLVDSKTPVPLEPTFLTPSSIATSQGKCDKCSNCSNHSQASLSNGQLYRDLPRNDQNRSLIIDGVLEKYDENLVQLSLHFVNSMGVKLMPDDVETAFRLGRPDRSRARPRPVKLVLNTDVIRNQIYHFKTRLRYIMPFKIFKLSLDQEKDVRVRLGILKRAANTARAMGCEFFYGQNNIKIDGIEYDSLHTNTIPPIYLPDEPSPPTKLNL